MAEEQEQGRGGEGRGCSPLPVSGDAEHFPWSFPGTVGHGGLGVAGRDQGRVGPGQTQARYLEPQLALTSPLHPPTPTPAPQGRCPPLCREQSGYHLKSFTQRLHPQPSSGAPTEPRNPATFSDGEPTVCTEDSGRSDTRACGPRWEGASGKRVDRCPSAPTCGQEGPGLGSGRLAPTRVPSLGQRTCPQASGRSGPSTLHLGPFGFSME